MFPVFLWVLPAGNISRHLLGALFFESLFIPVFSGGPGLKGLRSTVSRGLKPSI